MSNNSTEKSHDSKVLETEIVDVMPKEATKNTDSKTEVVAKKSINKTYLYGGIIVLVLVLIGGGFYLYQQNQAKNANPNQPANNRGANGQRNGENRANFSTVSGKVASIVDKNLIVDVANNGGQKIILLSDTNTQISKTEDSNKDNILKIDQTVSVDGDKNSDTVTAKTITLRQIQAPNPQNPAPQGQMPNQGMIPGGNNGAQGGRMMGANQNPPNGAQNFIFGKITAIEGGKVTIQSQGRPNPQNMAVQGNSNPPSPTTTTILITNDTKYKQQTNLKISEIQADQAVTVTGMTDPSGSITARSVVIE